MSTCKSRIVCDTDCSVSASGDRSIRLWDVEKGTLLYSIEGHSRGIACLDVDFDSRTIVTGSGDSAVKSFHIGKNTLEEGATFFASCCCSSVRSECVRCARGHTELVRSVHLGRGIVVSGSYDSSVKVRHVL
jgi:WD40 repeat protein